MLAGRCRNAVFVIISLELLSVGRASVQSMVRFVFGCGWWRNRFFQVCTVEGRHSMGLGQLRPLLLAGHAFLSIQCWQGSLQFAFPFDLIGHCRWKRIASMLLLFL